MRISILTVSSLWTLLAGVDGFSLSSFPQARSVALRMAVGDSLLDLLPFGKSEPEEQKPPVSSFLPVPDFQPTPQGLITRAKVVLASELGVQDESLLADDFIWIGAGLGSKVLGKTDYIAAGKFFNLRASFPDLDYRAHDFRIDEKDPWTVRLTARTVGTMRGELRLRNEVLPPNGKQMKCPPEAISMTFDESTGKLLKLCSGFTMDRLVGNTGGLCGIMGAATVAGASPSEWAIYPATIVLKRFFGRPVTQLEEPSSFLAPFPESVMIQLSKGILAANIAADDPSLLSASFTFSGQFEGPISKNEYVENIAPELFPGIDPGLSNFRVDPYDPYRVWCDVRPEGITNDGVEIDGPPQAMSFTFDDDGFCTRITAGAVMDPSIGNTGGLGGIEGNKFAAGKASLGIASRPLPQLLGRIRKQVLSPVTKIGVDEYLLEGRASKPSQPTITLFSRASDSEPSGPVQKATAAAKDEDSKPKAPMFFASPQVSSVKTKSVAASEKGKTSGAKSPVSKSVAKADTVPKLQVDKKVQLQEQQAKAVAKALERKKARAEAEAARKERAAKAEAERKERAGKAKELARAEVGRGKLANKAEVQRKERAALAKDRAAQAQAARKERVAKAEAEKRERLAKAEAARKERAAKAEAEKRERLAKAEAAKKERTAKAEAERRERLAKAEAAKKERAAKVEAQKQAQAKAAAEAAAAATTRKSQKSQEKVAQVSRATIQLPFFERRESKAKESAQKPKEKPAQVSRATISLPFLERTEETQKEPKPSKTAQESKKKRMQISRATIQLPFLERTEEKQRDSNSAKTPSTPFGSSPSAKKSPPPKQAAKAPKGVPTLTGWRKNRDGSVTGFISGSKAFEDGERVTTSTISKGAIAGGSLVQTQSGSRYFLK